MRRSVPQEEHAHADPPVPISSSEWGARDGRLVVVSALEPRDRPTADPRFVFEPSEVREIAASVLEEWLAKGQSRAQQWLDSPEGQAIVATLQD